MAEQSAQQEPSMEEILASIRRIISEDGEEEAAADGAEVAAGPVAVDTPAPEPELEPEPDAEPDIAPEPVAAISEPEEDSAAAADEDDFDAIAVEPDPAPEPEAFADEDTDDVLELTQEAPAPESGEPIVSHMTEAATSEHLKALSGLMVRSYPGSENTLEGVVREMLKPMLREWLDANLPTLVEQMVNREIARIAGRDK